MMKSLFRVARPFSSQAQSPTFLSIFPSTSRILKITGEDFPSIFQGLATNNFQKFEKSKSAGIQHTAFLNSKGKIITDAFLVKPLKIAENGVEFKKDEIWMEFPHSVGSELGKHIKKHSFGKKIKFEDISDRVVSAAFYVKLKQFSAT